MVRAMVNARRVRIELELGLGGVRAGDRARFKALERLLS